MASPCHAASIKCTWAQNTGFLVQSWVRDPGPLLTALSPVCGGPAGVQWALSCGGSLTPGEDFPPSNLGLPKTREASSRSALCALGRPCVPSLSALNLLQSPCSDEFRSSLSTDHCVASSSFPTSLCLRLLLLVMAARVPRRGSLWERGGGGMWAMDPSPTLQSQQLLW